MSFWKFLRGNKKYVEQERQDDKHQALVADAMILAMACIAEADGNVDKKEMAKMAQIYARITGNQANPKRVKVVVEQALAAEDNIDTLLENLARDLESTDKANIIHAGVLVALADDDFDISEQSEIWRLGQTLGVSADSLRGIIERAQKG